MSVYPLRSAWSTFKETIVWLLSYVFILYVFIFTAPFAVYRKVITVVAKIYDKDITTGITGLSTIFHRDFDSYHEKPLHAIVACLRVKGGNLSVSLLQKYFMEKVVLKNNPKTGKVAYPELQQHFTRFMGYSFLKWDRSFDISKHVIVYNDDNEMVVTQPVLMELWQYLMVKPFPRNRSPWEVVLVENYVGEKGEGENAPDWIIFVRINHAIADGFCFENILSSLFETDYTPDFYAVSHKSKEEQEKLKTQQKIQNVMLYLQCLAKGPYELVNRGIRFADDFHALHIQAEKKCNEYFVLESPRIPVKEIKQIKQRLGIGFTAVLLGVACGAVRQFLIKNGTPLPAKYTATIPFPSKPKREDKLENDFLLASIDLPIHLDNQKERMSQIQSSLENLKYSGFMKMLDIFTKQMSNLPSALLRAVSRKSMFSLTYSSIPGPDKIIRGGLGGCDFVEASFTHGLSSDSLGFALSSLTFAGQLRMTFFVDRNLMNKSREKAAQFMECLMQEYEDLNAVH